MINDDWSRVMTWQADMREREREREREHLVAMELVEVHMNMY